MENNNEKLMTNFKASLSQISYPLTKSNQIKMHKTKKITVKNSNYQKLENIFLINSLKLKNQDLNYKYNLYL